MNLSKKSVNILASLTLLVGLTTSVISNISYATIAPFEAKDFCKNGASNCLKEDKSGRSGSISCPDGKVIENVYVHAGDGQTVYQLPHEGFSVVYSNNNNTATVTVTTHQHDLSWLGVTCAEPTPTDDPTPTPTDDPTPTPTSHDYCPNLDGEQNHLPDGYHYDNNGLCIVLECDGDSECEVVIGGSPTPTPTLTPTNTPTATPTPGSNGGSSIVQSSSGSSDGGSSSSPSVPAGTMAPTGAFGSIMSNASLLAGFILTSLGLPGYAKRKKK